MADVSFTEHLAAAFGLSESTVIDLLQGDVQLLVAKALLKQGDLREAARLLEMVSKHSVDAETRRDLATQFLALARAWKNQPEVSESNVNQESALRHAATVDPALGLPALAQYLQRQKEPAEALGLWREAIRVNPQQAIYYLNLARLYEHSHQIAQALTTYLDLIVAVPSAKNYLIVA
ncbi:MAG: hypothetical protein PVSMB10_14370 [Pseudarthrobacter sp.]